MCRFVYYQGESIRIGELLTEPAHSLIHQSWHSHERSEPLNGDGFGVGWYVDGDDSPTLFRSVSPAWSNTNLKELSRVTASRRMLAHVRAATPGTGVTETNCHPFRMPGLAFMHNGDLGGFPLYRRALLERTSDAAFHAVRGTTDSEAFFALLWDAWTEQDVGPERLVRAFQSTLSLVLKLWEASRTPDHIYLNCLVTDGADALACRFTTDDPSRADTLYSHLGKRYTCRAGMAELIPCPDNRTSVLVSSEPLTPDQDWQPIGVGDFLVISGDQVAEAKAIALG